MQVTPVTEYTPEQGFGLADAGSVTAEARGADAGAVAFFIGGKQKAQRAGGRRSRCVIAEIQHDHGT